MQIKKTVRGDRQCRAQGLCESGGGRPGLPVPNSPYGLCGRKAALNCVKVEVDVRGSPSLIVLWDLRETDRQTHRQNSPVDVKHH